MAVGVASPKAHGQAITITAAKYKSDTEKETPSIKYQTTKVKRAIIITVGTKTADILSAKPCMGALLP